MNFANDGWTREVSIEDVSKQERPAILQRKRYVALGQGVAQQLVGCATGVTIWTSVARAKCAALYSCSCSCRIGVGS